jgi:hypothetical protein
MMRQKIISGGQTGVDRAASTYSRARHGLGRLVPGRVGRDLPNPWDCSPNIETRNLNRTRSSARNGTCDGDAALIITDGEEWRYP